MRFRTALLAIAGVALVLRALDAYLLAPPLSFLDDDTFYHHAALSLADGHGYAQAVNVSAGAFHKTAEHPPLYPAALSLIARLGGRSVDAQRSLGILVGTGTVGLVGLIARRLGGNRAGLLAAGLAALFGSFVAADGALMSESLFAALVASALLCVLRMLERPSWTAAATTGALLGLAVLTRAEAILLALGVVGIVLVWAPAHRARTAGVVAVVTLLVVAPWVIRNWHVFQRPVLANDGGLTVAAANCHDTYYGPDVAGASLACAGAAARTIRSRNEAVRAARLQSIGFDYARAHRTRAVEVAVLRVGRVWGLWKRTKQFQLTGRRRWVQRDGVYLFYVLLPLAGLGAWSLRRRRPVLAVMLAPVLAVTVAGALSTGNARLRTIGELSVLCLAGAGLVSVRSLRARETGPYTESR